MSRKGERETKLLPGVAAAIEGALTDLLPPLPEGMPETNLSVITKSGLEGAVAEMRFAGFSARRMALRLGVTPDCMERYLASGRFAAVQEAAHDFLMNRLDEAIRSRVQEAYIGAVEDLLAMRDKAKGFLRRQLNMDVIELNEKYAGVGKGAPSANLRAVHERLVKRKDGSTERVRQTVEGPKEAVAAAFRGRRDDATASGGSDGPDAVASEDPGGAGTTEDAAPAALEGGDGGSGEAVAEPAGEAGSEGEKRTDPINGGGV